MYLHLEKPYANSIQSYHHTAVTIGDVCYQENLLVTQDTLISNWQVEENTEWTLSALSPLIALKPKIILLGQTKVLALPPRVIAHLQAQKIGIEAMSLGAACRTFNILLQEGRMVCLGILLAFSGKAPIA